MILLDLILILFSLTVKSRLPVTLMTVRFMARARCGGQDWIATTRVGLESPKLEMNILGFSGSFPRVERSQQSRQRGDLTRTAGCGAKLLRMLDKHAMLEPFFAFLCFACSSDATYHERIGKKCKEIQFLPMLPFCLPGQRVQICQVTKFMIKYLVEELEDDEVIPETCSPAFYPDCKCVSRHESRNSSFLRLIQNTV